MRCAYSTAPTRATAPRLACSPCIARVGRLTERIVLQQIVPRQKWRDTVRLQCRTQGRQKVALAEDAVCSGPGDCRKEGSRESDSAVVLGSGDKSLSVIRCRRGGPQRDVLRIKHRFTILGGPGMRSCRQVVKVFGRGPGNASRCRSRGIRRGAGPRHPAIQIVC